MATYKKSGVDTKRQYSNAAGNLSAFEFTLELASGAGGGKDTALIATDICQLGIIPGGMRIMGAEIVVSSAFTTGSTLDIGFEYVDGVDSTVVPEDPDYFADALDDLVSRAGMPATNAPVRLEKDAYLIVTNNAITQAETASKLTVVVWGILEGHK